MFAYLGFVDVVYTNHPTNNWAVSLFQALS